MENKNRVFTGLWIPSDIYLNQQVKWISKVLFLEIHSFTANEKPCFMSNDYISNFLGVSNRQVTRIITELKEIGWINETSFDGRKRFLISNMKIDMNTGKAKLTKSSNQDRTKGHISIDKNVYDTKTTTKPSNSFKRKEKREMPKRGESLK